MSKPFNPNLASYTLKHSITENDSDIFCVRYSPDDSLLVMGCGDGYLRVFSSVSGKMIYQWSSGSDSEIKLPITSLRFRPEREDTKSKNIVLCAGAGGVLQHWHITSGRLLHTITEPDNQSYAVDFSRDGKSFASAGKDATVRVYDEATKTKLIEMSGGNGVTTAGHSNRIFALKFHPTEDNILLTGGWDNTVQIWDTRVDHAVRRIFGPHICGDALDIDRNGTILTGSWRPSQQLQFWDYGSGQLIEDLRYPVDVAANAKCNLYTAQFNNCSGTMVAAGGSGANEAKIMRREGWRRVGGISGLDKAVYCLTFSSDSRQCAIGGGDGSLYVLHTK